MVHRTDGALYGNDADFFYPVWNKKSETVKKQEILNTIKKSRNT